MHKIRMIQILAVAACCLAATWLAGCRDRVADVDRDITLDEVFASNDALPADTVTGDAFDDAFPPAQVGDIAPSPFVQPVLRDRPLDPYTLQYNPTTVITLRGAVLGFRRISLEDDRTGLFVRISGGGDLLWVYLGPEQWLIDHGVRPDMTEQFSVTGSMINTERERLMIAREIAIDGLRVELRDDLGTPNWSPRLEAPPPPKRTQAELNERRREYLERRLLHHEKEAAEIRHALQGDGVVR
jgi:hypothetical protein